MNHIFYRLSLNRELPVIILPSTVDAYKHGNRVDIGFEAGKVIVAGEVYNFSPLTD